MGVLGKIPKHVTMHHYCVFTLSRNIIESYLYYKGDRGALILNMAVFRVAVLFISLLTFRGLNALEEPICTSRFDFEEKLLSKLVRMEYTMELLQERISKEMSAIKEEKVKMGKDFLKFKETLIIEQAAVTDKIGKMSGEIEQRKLKLSDDFKTFSRKYDNKIQRISDDLTDAINKSLNNEKSK